MAHEVAGEEDICYRSQSRLDPGNIGLLAFLPNAAPISLFFRMVFWFIAASTLSAAAVNARHSTSTSPANSLMTR
ncbi:hypothetical protein KC349_g83 [Hortaea werneckii]|nr:hypothetical protein KC349_g83 [Hortaea werneckii]